MPKALNKEKSCQTLVKLKIINILLIFLLMLMQQVYNDCRGVKLLYSNLARKLTRMVTAY